MASQPQGKKYHVVAIAFHWIIAILVLFLLFWGHFMTDLPKGSFERLEAFQFHQSVGLTLLMLTLFRLAWRLKHPALPAPPGLKHWEEKLREFTHIGFYVLLILLPLSGWTIASTSPLGVPIEYFGLFEWPFLPFLTGLENKQQIYEVFVEIHHYLGWGIIALFIVHMVGISKHTFILKDDLWKRMIPGK